MKKSIKINAIANILKTIFSIIFPLITFPYVSRILGVDNYGVYQFSNSVITYFLYIASLGISTYAIRTGSGIKNNRDEFEKFINEIFSINIISMIISYLLLLICLIFIKKLEMYRLVIFIMSFSIVFSTYGVDWIFSIYEDYVYTCFRTICIQIFAIILMFIFVKSQSDLIQYAIISTIASSGYNLVNIFYSRRYCKLKFTFRLNLKKHFFPIFVLFANNISIIIYVNSDITLLGLIIGNTAVGLYGLATKVYSLVKQVLNSITIVIVPRLSMQYNQNKLNEMRELLNKSFSIIFSLLLPCCLGLFSLSKEIVILLSGDSYILSVPALKILSVSLFFSGIASFYSSAILIPTRKETFVLKSTIIGALFNILGNIILLPLLGISGAALTTLFSEILVLLMFIYYSREISFSIEKNIIIITILESICILIISSLLKLLYSGIILIILTVILSFVIYIFLNFIFNTIIFSEIKKIFNKFENERIINK